MSSKDCKKFAFSPNRKIFSHKFIRLNAELDERKTFFDIMGTLKLTEELIAYVLSTWRLFILET